MSYKYLHDLSIIELGKRYRFRLMPEKRLATGTVILVEPNKENPSKGKIHTENDSARLYAGEYQYYQYTEYPDEPEVSDLFSDLKEFKEFVGSTFHEGMECEGLSSTEIQAIRKIDSIIKDWIEYKRIKL